MRQQEEDSTANASNWAKRLGTSRKQTQPRLYPISQLAARGSTQEAQPAIQHKRTAGT